MAGYMVLVAAGLTTVYVAQSIAFVRTGALPAIVAITGHPTSLVFALDLPLVVPALLVGAFWLQQDRAVGIRAGGHRQRQGRGLYAVAGGERRDRGASRL